jgi:ribosomal protein S18 acetylase RimI-like enzyme
VADLAIRKGANADSEAFVRLVAHWATLHQPVRCSGGLRASFRDDDGPTLVACERGDTSVSSEPGAGRSIGRGRYGQIMALAVALNHRRRGGGQVLMRSAESALVEQEATILVVTSGNHRTDAHACYERCGSSFTGHRYETSIARSFNCHDGTSQRRDATPRGGCTLALLSVALLLAGLGAVPSAHAQHPAPLARVEALGLDTARVGRVTVHFAPADRERAAELAALAEAAAAFYDRELGVSFDFGVATLAPDHWFSEFPDLPYAIPWVSGPDRLLFVASSLSEGFMVRGPTPLHDRRRIDAGLLHEYGHLLQNAYLRPESEWERLAVHPSWLGELLANYVSYAYIASADPAWAEGEKAMRRGVVEGYTPPVLSLEWGFMGDLPPDELARTYAWYQNLLTLRAAALYEAHGLCFLRALRDRLRGDPASWTTESILPSLEAIAPGFEAWSNDLLGSAHLPRDD